MKSRATAPAQFDDLALVGAAANRLPYTKLTEAVEAQLDILSERVRCLEDETAQSLISTGLLITLGTIFYIFATAPLVILMGVFAAYAGRNIPANIYIKRQTIADIASFEDRLSERNIGIKWSSQRPSSRMSVRIFWRSLSEG